MTTNFLAYKGIDTTEANFSTHFAACAGILSYFAVKTAAAQVTGKDIFDLNESVFARPYIFLAVVNALNGCDAAAQALGNRKGIIQDEFLVTRTFTKHNSANISLLGLLDGEIRKESQKYFDELDRLGIEMSPRFLASGPIQRWLEQDAILFAKAAALIFDGVDEATKNQDLANTFIAEQRTSFGLADNVVTPWQDISGHIKTKGCGSPSMADLCKATRKPSAIFTLLDGVNLTPKQIALGVR